MSDRLAEIRARVERTTPGDWCYEPSNRDYCGNGSGEGFLGGILFEEDDEVEPYRNAEFVAHAHQDVPWLLAEVERLHKLEAAVRYYHNGHGYMERSERWQAVMAILEGTA